MYQAKIPLSQFYKYSLLAAQEADFCVVLCLIAREADSPNLYKELSQHWSSLHDLTGKGMLFLFAGETVNAEASDSISHSSGIVRYYSDAMRLTNPYKLRLSFPINRNELDDIGTIKPKLKKDDNLTYSQTIQISDLRDTLLLSEKDIPALHFTILDTNENFSFSIKDYKEFSIYAFLKGLIGEWESIFSEIYALTNRIGELNKNYAFLNDPLTIQKRSKYLLRLEKAKENIQEFISSEQNPELKAKLIRMLEIINTSWVVTCFSFCVQQK